MAYAKALREKLGRVEVALQAIIDKAKNEEPQPRPHLQTSESSSINSSTEGNDLEASIAAAEKVTKITDRLAAGNGPIKIDEAALEEVRDEFHLSRAEKRRKDNEKNPHARAFSTYLRAAEDIQGEDKVALMRETATLQARGLGIPTNLMAQFKNAQSSSPGSAGGYLIPQGFSNMLEEAKKWFGGIEGTVDRFETGTGNPMPWPTLNDTTNKGRIIGQNVQVIETDLTFNQVIFNAYIRIRAI